MIGVLAAFLTHAVGAARREPNEEAQEFFTLVEQATPRFLKRPYGESSGNRPRRSKAIGDRRRPSIPGDETMTGGRLGRVASYVEDEDRSASLTAMASRTWDISAEIAFHKRHGKWATVTAVQPPGRYGALKLDETQVTGFTEKPQGTATGALPAESANARRWLKRPCAFTNESIKAKYSTNIPSWLGRPIIRYPQDIIVMQELIWSIQPDLIIETSIARRLTRVSASMLELNAACGGPQGCRSGGCGHRHSIRRGALDRNATRAAVGAR